MKLTPKTKLTLFMLTSYIFGVLAGRTLPQWEDLIGKHYEIVYWTFFIMMVAITWLSIKKYQITEVD